MQGQGPEKLLTEEEVNARLKLYNKKNALVEAHPYSQEIKVYNEARKGSPVLDLKEPVRPLDFQLLENDIRVLVQELLLDQQKKLKLEIETAVSEEVKTSVEA